jgi:hypothetical protein
MFTLGRGHPECMETTTQQADVPDLRETPGGWLAVAVDSPRIAVIGKTRDDALTSFRAERMIWRELMAQAASADAGNSRQAQSG